MTITSLSFAFVQYTSTPALAAAAPVAVQASTAAPAPTPSESGRAGCGSPHRSPLYRAIKDALAQMMPAASTATSSTSAASTAGASSTPNASAVTSTTATTGNTTADATNEAAAAATESSAPAAPSLDEAMMNFARALMQALRGRAPGHGDDGEGGEGRGHHRHHHHGHGHWGDPAQRVDALAQQVGATTRAPVASTAATSAVATPATTGTVALPSAATTPPPATVGDVNTEPVVAGTTASAARGASSTMIFVAAIRVDTAAPAANRSPYAGLLDAFAALQKAMGKPAATGDDALKGDLATFLQSLSQRLGREDPATAEAATQPGALLSVAA